MAIRPSGGFFMSVAHEIAYMIYFCTEWKAIRPLQVFFMNVFLVIGWVLDKIDPTKERLPQSYICVFRKKN